MDGFDRTYIILMFMILLALAVGALCLATDLAERVEVLEQAVAEAKP